MYHVVLICIIKPSTLPNGSLFHLVYWTTQQDMTFVEFLQGLRFKYGHDLPFHDGCGTGTVKRFVGQWKKQHRGEEQCPGCKDDVRDGGEDGVAVVQIVGVVDDEVADRAEKGVVRIRGSPLGGVVAGRRIGNGRSAHDSLGTSSEAISIPRCKRYTTSRFGLRLLSVNGAGLFRGWSVGSYTLAWKQLLYGCPFLIGFVPCKPDCGLFGRCFCCNLGPNQKPLAYKSISAGGTKPVVVSLTRIMENFVPLMRSYRTKLKQASVLWLEGFREACCLHKVVIYCLRSKQLMIRTGQCFLLNGFIFLGSIFILRSLILPTLQWILPFGVPDGYQEPCLPQMPIRLYAFLRLGLLQLIYALWFYPLYIFSFILSTIWYNDIAQFGLTVTGKDGSTNLAPSSQKEPSTSQNATHVDKPTDLGRVMIGIAEQGYSLLLLTFFFLEVYLTGFIPYIGKALNFVLLSWMYAYYCFEYKWNFSGLSLDKRLDFFESNWAFFAGFGSPCVLAIFFFSPLVSYGVMAVLFPLFVLTAAGSDADSVINSHKTKWSGEELRKLPIFYAADKLLMWILSLLPVEPSAQTSDKKSV
ncbi:hypothetical protein L6452_22604 [Arctium lappa]|uniref:Uncharacterized protein n=1 Tax=Arctium lappa TaxID=4217 RepID=A0ACB9B0L3_ARCLA|nr:hypothetical protein L6452_22604 [Arctium lappa]